MITRKYSYRYYCYYGTLSLRGGSRRALAVDV